MQHSDSRRKAVGGAAGAGDALHGRVVGVLRLGFCEGSRIPLGFYG